MGFLVLSGSLPRGVTPNLYGQLILAGKKNRAFILLDADGSTLTESIAFGPDCIKPNLYELSRLVGRELTTDKEILAACQELHQRGVPSVLVSRGEAGLLFSNQEQRLKAVAPPVVVDSTVGAGDSAVAGFILALSQGRDMAECVRLACAAGTATAKTPGTELCSKKGVEEILSQVQVEAL
jgi:1-phosphofructokinase family hexose kinase